MPSTRLRVRSPLEVRFPRLGLLALESRHARGFHMPPLRHDYLKALVVFSGDGTLHADGGALRLPLSARGVAVVPPGCEHRIEDKRPISLYALCFRAAEFGDGWPKALCRSGKPELYADPAGEWPDMARRLLHEQTATDPGSTAMTRSLGWQMLAWLARAPCAAPHPVAADDRTGSRARVLAAAAELGRRFYESLTIDIAASRAGLGRRRFTQLFREVHGRSWWDALTAARLDHAERLLRLPNRSVTAVAFECGYGDLSGFYRAWASRHAKSPLAWQAATPTQTGAEPGQERPPEGTSRKSG